MLQCTLSHIDGCVVEPKDSFPVWYPFNSEENVCGGIKEDREEYNLKDHFERYDRIETIEVM